MFKSLSIVIALSLLSAGVFANDTATMVKNADAYRLDTASAKVVSLVTLYKTESWIKHANTMFIRAPNASLWLCLSHQLNRGKRC